MATFKFTQTAAQLQAAIDEVIRLALEGNAHLSNTAGYLVPSDIAGKADAADVYTKSQVDAVVEADSNPIKKETIGISLTYDSSNLSGIERYKDGYQISGRPENVGKNIDEVPTSSSASANYKTYIIPVAGAESVTFESYATTAGYGSLFTDDDGRVLLAEYRTSAQDNPLTVKVPEGATKFYWNRYGTTFTCTVNYANKMPLISQNKEEIGNVERSILGGNITYRFNDLSSVTGVELLATGTRYNTAESQMGKIIDEAATSAADGYNCYIIPIPAGAKRVFANVLINSTYGAAILDADRRIITSVLRKTSSDPIPTTVIPDNGAFFFWQRSGRPTDSGTSIVRFEFDHAEFNQDWIENGAIQTQTLQAIGAGDTAVKSKYYEGLVNGKTYTVDVVNPNIDMTGITVSSAYTRFSLYLYDVDGNYTQHGKTLIGSNLPASFDFTVPDDGKRYYCYLFMRAAAGAKQLIVIRPVVSSGSSDESPGSVQQRTGAAPRYKSGIINEHNGVDENAKYVTTEPIFGNFSLGLADGFRIYSGSLVDRDGNMVSYNHVAQLSDVTAAQSDYSERLVFASANMPHEYGYRFVICKADQTDITDGETVIATFVSMGDSNVRRWIPDNLPNYDIAQRRIDYMQRILWTPIYKVPDGSSSDAAANASHCLAGRLQLSMPYSDLGLTRKFVPWYVSPRTFLTAAKNKRSLLYTENLFSKTSGYGIDYTGAYRCGSYYGCACNAFTGWVMDGKSFYQSGNYHNNTVPGLSTISNPTVDDIWPLDFIWNDGHISMVSDVFKDEYGKVKFIVWAEMTTPHPKRTLYTPERFMARVNAKSAEIHRWNGWSGITEPADIPGYNLHQLGGVQCDVPYCKDIMCFAGDYAAFAEGDIIYLNARRANTYTGVQLYKDDELLQTIDITTLAVDGNDGEDWVRVNLTTLNLTAGKYKACLTDGTNTTGFTYFEVVGISFSAVRNSSSSVTMTFSATGGTPLSLELCSSAGFMSQFHNLTDTDRANGTVTKSWTVSDYYAKLYLIVQGDYGKVIKVIANPTA